MVVQLKERVKQHSKGSLKKVLWEISQNSKEKYVLESLFSTSWTLKICSFIKNEVLAQVFSCEFSKIRKNTCFAEHHMATASDCSSINISDRRIGKRYCKLWYEN